MNTIINSIVYIRLKVVEVRNLQCVAEQSFGLQRAKYGATVHLGLSWELFRGPLAPNGAAVFLPRHKAQGVRSSSTLSRDHLSDTESSPEARE